MPETVVVEHWFRGSLVLRAIAGLPPGWRNVRAVDDVFPEKFKKGRRPDFIWDVFDAPTDLAVEWKGGDAIFTWEPARAIIEVKTLEADWNDRMESFAPTASVPTALDYLVLKLKPDFVKADRQIGAARGQVAGHESLGVLAFVNERYESLPRADAIAALDRLRREHMRNTNVIVYFHDRCTNEPIVGRRADGSYVQVHRVSLVGDPSHALSRVFLKEFKQAIEFMFRPENFPPASGERKAAHGIVQIDPEGTWGDLNLVQGGWTLEEVRPRRARR